MPSGRAPTAVRTDGRSHLSATVPATTAAMRWMPRKIERELDWTPAETFETGLRKTVRWYLDNTDWVERVADGSYRDWVQQNYSNR